jgi:hypothetical protein
MNDITLRAEHAIELAELLEFLHDWTTTDHQHISESLARFTHSNAYNLDALHADLTRFAFLLGGTGEQLLHRPEET